tara:strand:- start:1461 stop:1676 length:216 start_codon:yes stop_codon:yes gene_type:complete
MKYCKAELIMTLKLAIKQLEEISTDENTKMFSSIDTGGYGGDCEEIVDFDLGFEYHEDDNVLHVSSYLERV